MCITGPFTALVRKAVIGPAFTPGYRKISFYAVRPIHGPPGVIKRISVNGHDNELEKMGIGEPVLKHGPITAPRKRP
jgi:hypothetical protein